MTWWVAGWLVRWLKCLVLVGGRLADWLGCFDGLGGLLPWEGGWLTGWLFRWLALVGGWLV